MLKYARKKEKSFLSPGKQVLRARRSPTWARTHEKPYFHRQRAPDLVPVSPSCLLQLKSQNLREQRERTLVTRVSRKSQNTFFDVRLRVRQVFGYVIQSAACNKPCLALQLTCSISTSELPRAHESRLPPLTSRELTSARGTCLYSHLCGLAYQAARTGESVRRNLL